ELKSHIHRKLIGVLNLERVASIPKDRVRMEIGRVVERLLEEERVPMTTAEQTKIVEEVLDEVLGLGPLKTLLKEPSISDIMVNRYNKVFIERNGKLSATTVRFKDDAHLLHIIEKIVSQVGRRIDEAQPIVDARLQDGSRVNAIIPPLALDGPCLSIRRFGRHVITQDEMIEFKTLTPGMLRFLSACVQCKCTVLISGGTGSAKTTTLNALSRLETMVMMADLEIPARVILQQLASAIRLVVQVSRLQDGTRKVLSISEVLGVKDEKVDLQEIFTFERIGVTDAGKVQGRFMATGIMPKIMERLRISGIQLPHSIFEEVLPVNLS